MDGQLNILDAMVLAVVGLSAMIAFFRGFLKEILSLGAWVGAAIIAFYFFPDVAEYVKPKVNSDAVATGVAALGTYIIALLGISLINAVIIRYTKESSDVGFLDNFLGLVFGLLRGAFIVSLGFLIFSFIYKEEYYPDWVKEAKTLPYMQQGAEWLAQVSPKYLQDMDEMKEQLEKKRDERRQSGDEGYNQGRLKDLDRLLDSRDKGGE